MTCKRAVCTAVILEPCTSELHQCSSTVITERKTQISRTILGTLSCPWGRSRGEPVQMKCGWLPEARTFKKWLGKILLSISVAKTPFYRTFGIQWALLMKEVSSAACTGVQRGQNPLVSLCVFSSWLPPLYLVSFLFIRACIQLQQLPRGIEVLETSRVCSNFLLSYIVGT